MGRSCILVCVLCVGASLTFTAIAQERASSAVSSSAAVPAPTAGTGAAPIATEKAAKVTASPDSAEERAMRLEGEKRFRTNCGRCHQAPHRFPPRVMAAAIRHMRVRATITDDDMRLILRYMTR
jgi:mono/diheme cytochrome c family protein